MSTDKEKIAIEVFHTSQTKIIKRNFVIIHPKTDGKM